MEHSVQKYLERLSTPELEGALQYYLQEDRIENHLYAIREILRVLYKRYEPEGPPLRVSRAWEKYQQRIAGKQLDSLQLPWLSLWESWHAARRD